MSDTATDPAPAPPPVAPAAPAIRTVGLTKRYGDLTALDALDLELVPGDVFGFIGPNGAGKSTTMKIVAGLLAPTAGQAFVMGKSVDGHGDFVRRSVGYMPDAFGVYEDLTVREYLEFFASAYKLPRRDRKRVVGEVLELTDLSYKEHAQVDGLSRGMQQRLGLARVLVHDPPVLLLDEPASGLDPRARIEIRELLRELQRLGKTILVSSHILSELGEFCNKLGIIERGRLAVTGTVAELVARARTSPTVVFRCVGDGSDPGSGNGRAASVLRADARVARCDEREGALHVTLADAAMHHGFAVALLTDAGVAVDSVSPEQVKLEDVFLRLTKGIVS